MVPETMRAVGFDEHGDIDRFELLSVPTPTADRGEVLVEVAACALNRQDLLAVRELDHYVPDYPFWGGGDVAGRVAAVGDGVAGWTAGDRVVVDPAMPCGECEFCIQGEGSMCKDYHVLGEHEKGGFAEYIAVPKENCYPVPEDYPLQRAAAAPMAAGTAWRALSSRADLSAHHDALIVGATGGLGTYAVQFASRVINADTVYATTSSDDRAEFLRELGADHVVNYTEEDFDAAVWAATDGRGVDVVYNSVGGETWVPSMRALANGGVLVTSGATAGPNPETEIRLMFVRQFDVRGSTTHNRLEFRQAMDFVFEGPVEPVIDEVYPMDEFETAFRSMDDRRHRGKLVLSIGED
jgi:NADPH:quinone reductase-like Zn-dependent oxidoreductase